MCKVLKPTEDQRNLRNAFGKFPTGVAIVTTLNRNKQAFGMTINSFSSISLTPGLVSWCIDRKSGSYTQFSQCEEFSISVLNEDQVGLARLFATRGAEKFEEVKVRGSLPPVIPDCCGWFYCRTERSLALGDHSMLIGRILDFKSTSRKPLLFAESRFCQLAETESLVRAQAA